MKTCELHLSIHTYSMCVNAGSEDLKSLQAESEYPVFVLLMVLFRFYYSEYLTHLKSLRRLYPARLLSWNAARYSFPFFAYSSASIGHSYSFKLLPPLVCRSFHPPPLLHSCFLLWSIFLHLTNDRHWFTQSCIHEAHTQHKRIFFLRIFFFFNETQKKCNKIKINIFFLFIHEEIFKLYFQRMTEIT